MKNALCAATAAVALLVGASQPSHATLMLELSDGIHAPQFATDLDGDGAVTFSGAIGAFMFNVTTGISTPMIGTVSQPILDLNSVDVTSGQGGGTLTLTLTDGGYSGSGGIVHFLDSVGGTLTGGGTYSVSSSMGCGGQTTALTSQTFSGSSFSGGQDAYVNGCNGTYSLTQLAVLQLPGGAMFSGDASLAVPEPSTLALFGAGLLGLGIALRRKRQDRLGTQTA